MTLLSLRISSWKLRVGSGLRQGLFMGAHTRIPTRLMEMHMPRSHPGPYEQQMCSWTSICIFHQLLGDCGMRVWLRSTGLKAPPRWCPLCNMSCVLGKEVLGTGSSSTRVMPKKASNNSDI